MSAALKRKLIEVALPLEAINLASSMEKSIRHRHPSTLHIWWARRPLAACRAVLFAQLVNDPSAEPERFPTEELQQVERDRLFRLIERLVAWENTSDAGLLEEVHGEILRSCSGNPPTIVDPFAGGGSIPMEAQRLGLQVEASDLNPVAVTMNRALLDVPRRWLGGRPVSPGVAASQLTEWTGALGLAADIRAYGETVFGALADGVGGLYGAPRAATPGPVVAWLWTRTVVCPNPGCRTNLPLLRSRWLRKKRGLETYVVPQVVGKRVEFSIGTGAADAPTTNNDGTVGRSGATCIACGVTVPLEYIRSEGKAGRIGTQMLAVVKAGARRREYSAPTPEDEVRAALERPEGLPETDLPAQALGFRVQGYGMTTHADLFINRQLQVLAALSRVVQELHGSVLEDARLAGMPDGSSLGDDGCGAQAYADAIVLYMSLALDRVAMSGNSLCRWNAVGEKVQHLFGRQAISMLWDFAEANPLGTATGSWRAAVDMVANAVEGVPVAGGRANVIQADAATRAFHQLVVCTDPPYYDNVGYADLSDFFYVWLRPLLAPVFPDLFGTVLTPKNDELIANPFRHDGYENADAFFEGGFERVFSHVRAGAPSEYPMTVFYAFKQAEGDGAGQASTGWETLLSGMLKGGWAVTATWPIRTEMATRLRGMGSNALASSIVLACRPLPDSAEAATRRSFLTTLRAEMPRSLRRLQQGSVAPVDLAQAAIGPGMAVFSQYRTVIEADGSPMAVRTALALINQVLDEVLTEQEGDFDSDTRFCIKWFTQYGWEEGDAGTADTLSRATNTSVAGLERGGIFRARAGRARLLAPEELSEAWNPTTDDRVSIWEVVVRVAKALDDRGGEHAARLLALGGRRVDLDAAKELAYLLFSLCEKRGLTAGAQLFNGLGTSWADLSTAARLTAAQTPTLVQGALDLETDAAP